MTDQNQQGKDKLAKKLDNKELVNTGFWLSNIFMLIATVAGVYLAAQAGLQQAIIFDDMTSKQNNFYLRQSLYEEVKDNVESLKAYNTEYLSRSIPIDELRSNPPEVSYYVWETMKNSQTTLETPSKFLSEVRRFYSRTESIVEKREKRTYAASHAGKLMKAQIEHMENDVLPELKASADNLKAALKQMNVTVN